MGEAGTSEPSIFAALTRSRLNQIAFSMGDQALSTGGMLIANLALARGQTKEEYGLFALSYSFFAFLGGLHNAVILEPFTVYGAGRYREQFSEYFKLMAKWNGIVALVLMGTLSGVCILLKLFAPHLLSRAFIGLALTIGILLTASFVRRVFYLQRKPLVAAQTSLLFFLTVACGLYLGWRLHVLQGMSVFFILAGGWIAASLVTGWNLPFVSTQRTFMEAEPGYWREHWGYMRWVLLTAIIFQLSTQGYYWLMAGFLSVKDVADLRALVILTAPMDQIFIAINYLVLPILAARYLTREIRRLLPVWRKYASAIAAATVSFAIFIRLLGKPLVHFVYAGKFDNVAPLLATLALLPLIMGVGHTINAALKAAEMPKLVFYAYLCSGAATLVFGLPLVRGWGIRGAVYGMLISGAAYTGSLAIFFIYQLFPNFSDKFSIS